MLAAVPMALSMIVPAFNAPWQEVSDPPPLPSGTSSLVLAETNGPQPPYQVFELRTDQLEWWSVAVSSDSFNPALAVARNGATTTQNRSTGRLGDAYCTWLVEPGHTYKLVVLSEDQRSGVYTLTAVRGQHSAQELLRTGDWEWTLARLRSRLIHAQADGDAGRVVLAQLQIARVMVEHGRDEEAAPIIDEVLRAPAVPAGLGVSSHAFADVLRGRSLQRRGEGKEADAVVMGRLEEITGDPVLHCYALNTLVQLAEDRGDLTAAHSRSEELEAVAAATKQTALVAMERARREYWTFQSADSGTREAGLSETILRLEAASDLAETARSAEIQAAILCRLGSVHRKVGDPARCRLVMMRAMQLTLSPATRAMVLGEAGLAAMEAGRYGEARTRLEEAHYIAAQTGRGSLAEVTKEALAALSMKIGQYALARLWLAELVGDRQANSADRKQIGRLHNLALATENLGTGEGRLEAIRTYEVCLKHAITLGDPELEANVRSNFARTLRAAGRLEESEEHSRAVIKYASQTGHVLFEASGWEGLGDSAWSRSSYEEARRCSGKARELFRGTANPEYELHPMLTLARVALATGQHATAEELLADADKIIAQVDLEAGTLLDAAGWFSRFHEWGEVAQDVARDAWRRSAAGSPARETHRLAGMNQAHAHRGRALTAAMRQQVPTAQEPVSMAALAVRAKATIVEYVEGTTSLYAYVQRGERAEWLDLGERSPIEDAVDLFVSGLSGEKQFLSMDQTVECGGLLHRSLIQPVIDAVGDRGRWVIIPGRLLARLPFEALVLPMTTVPRSFGEIAYFGDERLIHYAPAAIALAELMDRTSPPPLSKIGRVFALGDPVYQSETLSRRDYALIDDSETLDRGGFDRLRETGTEVRELCQMVVTAAGDRGERAGQAILDLSGARSARVLESANGLLDVRLGEFATRDELLSIRGEYNFVHLACHGVVDRNDPRQSGLILSWDLNSGGVVTLSDIRALKIQTGLVVLSACKTAHGRMIAGEGVQSLANAFLEAGAKSVVATLWSVRDTDAKATMYSFYARFIKEGYSPAESLRRARVDLRHSADVRGTRPEYTDEVVEVASAHPAVWASFLYIGPPD